MSGKITLESGQKINLEINGVKYQASVHGFMSCTECHLKFGEDPHTKPSEAIPQDVTAVSEKIGHKAKIDPIAYSACNNCHDEIYSQVLASPHGENIAEKHESDAALCLDCHGSPHYITKSDDQDSKVNKWNVVETCGHCHGDKELTARYNIETNVLTSYTESFHGKKHHLGHKANDKFVAAITHKPVGPIPHYTEIALILLTLGVFAFIVLHVILEAFSDIRDAIYRKKRRSAKDESGKECV
jgi:hypothetical protein